MKNYSAAFILISLIFSGNVFSEPAAGSWTVPSTIEYIFIEGSDSVPRATLVIDGGVDTGYQPTGCPSNYITIEIDNEKGKAIYAMVLAAKMAGKSIKVSLPTCDAIGTRPKVNSIGLI